MTRKVAKVPRSPKSKRIQQGHNSYFTHRYLPPDPPPGHGPHRYAFQIFALSEYLAKPPVWAAALS
jgi:phosphatidylethanolamine-binding protein (PEBP) family uncharacterized protein